MGRCPVGSCPCGELSLRGAVLMESHQGGSCPGGNCPVGNSPRSLKNETSSLSLEMKQTGLSTLKVLGNSVGGWNAKVFKL